MRLLIPREGFEPVTFEAQPRVHLTDFGITWVRDRFLSRPGRPPIAGGSGQMSSWAEQQVLNHLSGQDNASWANLAPTFLALCTVVPTSSSTGSTITEASYTGYSRTSLAAATFAAASGTAPASAANSGTITGPACTAGSSTVIAMATCTASTAGNVIFWCSTTSTVISTTQTPPTISASGISLGLT